MVALKSQFIVHTLFAVLCALVIPGGAQAENIDFAEKYKQLLQEAKSAPSQGDLKELTFDVIEASQAAIKSGDYSAAVKIASLAVKTGKLSGNNHASALANSLKQRSFMLVREYRNVANSHKKLQTNPDDTHSAFLYGRFVAFKLNDWKEGLDWLAKGDDAAYRTLAKQERAILKDDDASLLKVANGWYQLGAEEKGLAKQDLELHAYDLYSRAWTHSTGAVRTAINVKLSEMPLRYLNHMEELDVLHGAWPFGKNGNAGLGGMFKVNHIKFPNGLGLVPPSRGSARVSYQLDGQYKTFVTGVALKDDTLQFNSTVTFTVLGDGRVLWKSPRIRDQNDVLFCKVSVKNIKRLEIRTETPGIARGAHAVWLDPHVLK